MLYAPHFKQNKMISFGCIGLVRGSGLFGRIFNSIWLSSPCSLCSSALGAFRQGGCARASFHVFLSGALACSCGTPEWGAVSPAVENETRPFHTSLGAHESISRSARPCRPDSTAGTRCRFSEPLAVCILPRSLPFAVSPFTLSYYLRYQ